MKPVNDMALGITKHGTVYEAAFLNYVLNGQILNFVANSDFGLLLLDHTV